MLPGQLIEDTPDDHIEFDDIAYDDPEYKVMTIKPQDIPDPAGKNTVIDWQPAQNTEALLNAGWHLYNWIVCRPFIMLFFSREKEITGE